MKVIQTVTEVSGEGLEALMGKNVLIFCFNYLYFGKLVGVNSTCVKLENVYQVFETGTFSDPKFKNAQKMPSEWYVQINAIESFGESFKTCI